MTDARLVQTVPDVDRARVFYAQARAFVSDASLAGLQPTSRQLLLCQGCLAACDAALMAAGFVIDGSDGGHALRFDEAVRIMGLDEELLEALNNARQVRAGSAYRAGLVMPDDADAAGETAARLIAEVEAFIEERGR